MPSPRPSFVVAALVGAGTGLFVFGLEGGLILRSSAIGLNLDVNGAFGTLLRAVRPELTQLLLRVAAAYVLAGIAAFLWCAALVRGWKVRSAWAAWAQLLCCVCSFGSLLVLDRAVARPALFDLAALGAFERWWVDHASPVWPRVAFAFLLCASLSIALWRRRLWRRPLLERLQFAVITGVLGAGALFPWAPMFPAETLRASSGVAAPAASRARHPLIVVIGIDAFRPDRLSAFGGRGDVAPNLEAFLGDAALFTNAWTPIAQTEPAWRSLLTARWPQHTGVRYPLTAESRWTPTRTFPQVLADAGFRTTFATDCSRFNYQPAGAGFTDRRQPPRGALNFVLEKLRFRTLGVIADNALGARWLPEFVDNRALAGLYEPVGFAQRLADTLVASARGGPTLFTLHGTSTHFPGDPVYPFFKRFVRADAPLARRERMFFSPIDRGAHAHAADLSWSREDAEALYDELLVQSDAQVGLLLAALVDAGLYDEATVVVFSDHGESFHADRPDLAGATPVHGARISSEENQILLAIKPPRSFGAPPAKVHALVRLVDVGPTVLALAGAPAMSAVDGQSLVPLLQGHLESPGWLYAETGYTHATPEVFDPDHRPGAPRGLHAYRVRDDGVVETRSEVHAEILAEKDFAAFDGHTWVRRSPRLDGSVARTCSGRCPAPQLDDWLDALTTGAPPLAGSVAHPEGGG